MHLCCPNISFRPGSSGLLKLVWVLRGLRTSVDPLCLGDFPSQCHNNNSIFPLICLLIIYLFILSFLSNPIWILTIRELNNLTPSTYLHTTYVRQNFMIWIWDLGRHSMLNPHLLSLHKLAVRQKNQKQSRRNETKLVKIRHLLSP